MRAAVFHEYGGPLGVEEVPDPTPPDDGVVVEVGATGICRSDWHAWEGHDPDVAPPHVPGHELAGTVVAVGPEVRRVAVGERVTVPFCLGCGACASCRAGETQVCDHDYQPGFTGWGSWAQYVALPHADLNVVPLPEGLDFVDAAALGCRFMTAWAALRVHARVAEGEWVAVHGCGGVGLSAVLVAVAAGARVVAVDVAPAALRLAAGLGATAVVEAAGLPWEDAAAAVRDATGGGAHVSLDALGSVGTCSASIASLRPRGRHVQVGLLPPVLGLPAVPMHLVIAGELEVLGSHGMAAHAYPELLGLVASGRLDPTRLVTGTVGLDGTPAALAAMGSAPPAGVLLVKP